MDSMTESNRRNVVIQRKSASNTYTQLFPKERADGITYNNDNTIITGIQGDGEYASPYPCRPFVLGSNYMFFLGNVVYKVSTYNGAISSYVLYTLRDGEYFVSVSKYSNSSTVYLLTNMGRLYTLSSSGSKALFRDFRSDIFSSDTSVTFNNIVYNDSTSKSFIAFTCSSGLYYTATSSYSASFTKVNTSSMGLESEVFKWVDIMSLYGTYYCLAFTEKDVIQYSLGSSVTFTKHDFNGMSYGTFKNVTNGVVIGTNKIWFPQYVISGLTENMIDTSSVVCSEVCSIDVNYGGWLVNDLNQNLVHLKLFTSSQKNFSDLSTDHPITKSTGNCFIFLLKYEGLILGITQNGVGYVIEGSDS